MCRRITETVKGDGRTYEVTLSINGTATRNVYGAYVVTVLYQDERGVWHQPCGTMFFDRRDEAKQQVKTVLNMVEEIGCWSPELEEVFEEELA